MPTLQGRRNIFSRFVPESTETRLGEVQSSTGCASYDDWEVDEVLHKNTLYKEIFISKLGNLTYRHPNTDHPNFTFYKKGRLVNCYIPKWPPHCMQLVYHKG